MKKLLLSLALLAVTVTARSMGGNPPSGFTSFGFGTIDKADSYATDTPNFWKDGQGTTCWDYSYVYLVPGWTSWSGNTVTSNWARNEMSHWDSAGQHQVFTFYYNGSDYSAGYNTAGTMSTWYDDLRLLCATIENYKPSHTPIIHIEPDMLGFFIRDQGASCYASPNLIKVGSATAPTGWGGAAWNTTNFPDTLQGWAKAITAIRNYYAPTTMPLIAHHYTGWAIDGDIMTSPSSQSAVNTAVDAYCGFLNNIMATGGTMDVFFADPSDRDADWWAKDQSSSARWSSETYDTTTFGSRTWGTMAYAWDRVSSDLGKRGFVWQIPNGNHFYKTMNNSNGHFRDNYSMAFLPSASSSGASGTPGDAYSASSTTTGPGFFANHGIMGVLFGEGYYDGTPSNGSDYLTHLRDYEPTDGTFNGSSLAYSANSPSWVPYGSATSNSSDNDGGYIRNAVAKYCSTGKFTLPGVGTPTYTRTPCTACTNTFTPTLTPSPVDCPNMLNNCDSLTSNGTWNSGITANTTLTIDTSHATQGTGDIDMTWSAAPVSFNDKAGQLTGFSIPGGNTLGRFDRITMDVYVPAVGSGAPWTATSGYHQMSVRADASASSKYEVMFTALDGMGLTAGQVNHLSWAINLTTTANISATDIVNKFYFVLNCDSANAVAGSIYIDNIVLHTDTICPTATPTATISPTSSPTVDCPTSLNSCNSLTANGAWNAAPTLTPNASISLDTNGAEVFSPATASIKVSYTAPTSFNDLAAQLTGFSLNGNSTLAPYASISFDVYVPATGGPWGATSIYHDFTLRADASATAKYDAIFLQHDDTPITTGWNHISVPLDLTTTGTGYITSTDVVNKIYFVLSEDATTGGAATAGYLCIDNVVLHTGKICPTATPTASITPTSSPTVDCPTTLNNCTVLSGNGLWNGTDAVQSINSNANYIAPGSTASVLVAITATAAFNQWVANLQGFAPTNWSAFKTMTVAVYVDPANTPWTTLATTHTLCLYADSQTAASPWYVKEIATNEPTLSTGWNYLTFTLAFPSGTNATDPLSQIYLVLKCYNSGGTSAAQAGNLYLDALVLHTMGICPTASPTSTASPTYSRSPTASPSPSPTRTPSPTATPSASPSASPTFTDVVLSSTPSDTATGTPTRTGTPAATSSDTPTGTPTGTPTRTGTSTSTVTDTPSITPTFTNVPPNSTATDTPSISPTSSATPSSTGTMSRTGTPSQTGTMSRTGTPTPASPGTATDTYTMVSTATPSRTATFSGTPSVTPSVTASNTNVPPNSTLTDTPTISPTSSVTLLSTLSDTPTGTVTLVSTGTPSRTATSSATPSVTPSNTNVPPNSTVTDTPTDTATASPTGTATRTSTYSDTPSATPTWTNVPPGSTLTDTPTISPTFTATGTLQSTIDPTAAPTAPAGSTPTFTITPTSTAGYSNTGVIAAVPYPNPNPQQLFVKLSGPADTITIRIYSPSLVESMSSVSPATANRAGWQPVAMPAGVDKLPNGIWFAVVSAQRNGRTAQQTAKISFYIRR